jgi:hypothetical protein
MVGREGDRSPARMSVKSAIELRKRKPERIGESGCESEV